MTFHNASPERGTLFHYTTAAGLLGILRESILWASHLRFLNDAQEGIYAQDLVIEAVRNMSNPLRDPEHWAHQFGESTEIFDKYRDAGIETFDEYRGFIIDLLESIDFGVYVACFCESGDLLSQWRAYGSDHGYAIEMRAEALASTLSALPAYQPATGLDRVRYGRDAAIEIVRMAVESVRDFNLNHPGVKAEYKSRELTALLALVKHLGFHEETEWRIFAAFNPDYSPPPVHFRPTPIAIVPYIELKLPPDAIVSVRVGPGATADVREAGVRQLLNSLGSKATVYRSEVPFRG